MKLTFVPHTLLWRQLLTPCRISGPLQGLGKGLGSPRAWEGVDREAWQE